MSRQFDVYRTGFGETVVILQSDLLDGINSRVVAALVPAKQGPRRIRHLNPKVNMGDGAFIFMPQLVATLNMSELGERIGSLSHMRDEIIGAMDALFSGI